MNVDRKRAVQTFEHRLYVALMVLTVSLVPLAYLSFSALVSVNDQHLHLTEDYARALVLAKDLLFQQTYEDNLQLRSAAARDAVRYTVRDAARDPARDSALAVTRNDFIEKTRVLQRLDPSPATAELLDSIRAKQRKLTLMSGSGLAPDDSDIERSLESLFGVELERFSTFRDGVIQSAHHVERRLRLSFLATGVAFSLVVLLLIRLLHNRRLLEQERERLYEQSEQTALIRKEVLETVAHDLKNPLSAIELSVHFAQRQIASNNLLKTAMSLQTALRSVNTMKEFIGMLLDQAKMEAGRFELELETRSLNEVVDHVAAILGPLAQQKSIAMSLSLDRANSACWLDRRQMTQVICNILGNAIKFTPQGGRIDIGSVVDAKSVQVSISDSGPGIPPGQWENVFARFWQARATSGDGTGLGLSIAKGVIEAHGGMIWAERSASGGAAFHFRIPRDGAVRGAVAVQTMAAPTGAQDPVLGGMVA